jgi:hypothetical protein
MKKLIMLGTLVLLVYGAGLTVAQKKESVKRVDVTAKLISAQLGKPYVIDLTRKESVYHLAAGIDHSRVRIRTSRGEQTISEVLGDRANGGSLLVGLTSDLKQLKLNLGVASRNFYCNARDCICFGDEDCDKLFRSGECGDFAGCVSRQPGDPPTCWCRKRL